MHLLIFCISYIATLFSETTIFFQCFMHLSHSSVHSFMCQLCRFPRKNVVEIYLAYRFYKPTREKFDRKILQLILLSKFTILFGLYISWYWECKELKDSWLAVFVGVHMVNLCMSTCSCLQVSVKRKSNIYEQTRRDR